MFKAPLKLKGFSFTAEQAYRYNKDSRTLYLCVEVNNDCNISCIYCPSGAARAGLNKQVSLSVAKSVIDQGVEQGISSILYRGGEPLLYKDFWPLMEYSYLRGIVPVIFTNSTLITKDVARNLYNLNVSVMAKLDSLDDMVQDFYTEVGISEKIRIGFDNLIEAGFNAPDDSGYTRMGASIYVWKMATWQLPDVWRFCRDNNIFPYIRPAGHTGFPDRNFAIGREENLVIQSMLRRIDGDEYNIRWDTGRYSSVPAHACWAFLAGCCINVDGDVSACSGTETIGNIFKDPLKDILRTEAFKRCRDFHNNVDEPCRSCADLFYCTGGCRVMARYNDGDDFSFDPYCPLKK
jgi:radical SAM protein with 4Fe4S-binding SPASM domain